MNKLLMLILALGIVVAPVAMAKGGGGGGRSSGGARSVSRPSTPKASAPKAPSKPSAPKVSTKPSASTKTVTASKPKTVGNKTFAKKGNVVDSNYQPKFRGYSAPAGSVVYYRESSMLDWLPFYMIMTSQQHREAVVVEPAKDGQPAKETVVKEEGTDGMYIWNWIFSILLVLGVLGGIVYLVNRRTR